MIRSLLMVSLLLGVCAACDDGSEAIDPPRQVMDGGVPFDTGVQLYDSTISPDADLRGPVLNSVIPNRSPVTGGQRLRVVGRSFVPGTTVQLGPYSCLDVEVENENHLWCTAPAVELAETVRMTARWPAGGRPGVLEDAFTFFEPLQVREITPAEGPAGGGAEVHFIGRGFAEPTEVRFGGLAGRTVEIDEDGVGLMAIAPPGTGVVDVVLRNINGEITLPGAFTYTERLVLDAVSPSWGWTEGETPVSLSGAGLLPNSEVWFGERGAEVLTEELGQRRLRVLSPAQGAGQVDVSVHNTNGEVAQVGAFLYVARAEGALAVYGLAPARLPTVGGASFVVAGRGFTETTRVRIDGEWVPCAFEAPQIMQCTSEPHQRGRAGLEVIDGEVGDTLDDAVQFYERVEIYDLRPAEGAQAGGTLVELVGSGLTLDMTLSFDEGELEIVGVEDEGARAFARTPAGRVGWTGLEVSTEDDRAHLPEAFHYFDPSTRYGGVWGGPIERSVNVTVLNRRDSSPVPDAAVLVYTLEGGGPFRGTTDARGQATVSDLGLTAPISVTAVAQDYEAATIERVTSENVTLFITPHIFDSGSGGGGSEPMPMSAITGRVEGLSALAKPVEAGLTLAAFVETTHTSVYNRGSLPWPNLGGVLYEDGPFEIVARPGELAAVVTAAYVPTARLNEFLNDVIGYTSLREEMTPVAFGYQRFLSVSPGETVDGVVLSLDRPLDLEVPVTLDNPPGGAPGRPSVYEVLPFLDFGPEGYFGLESGAIGETPELLCRYMPDLTDWDVDLTTQWIAVGRMSDDLWQPYVTTYFETRDLTAGVLVSPFVGTPQMISPVELGQLGPERTIEWSLHEGRDGPTEPPHATTISIVGANGKALWSHIVPGGVTRYTLPLLPDDIQPGGLIDAEMYLTLIPTIIDGSFNFEDFTYTDLYRRLSYSVVSIPFLP